MATLLDLPPELHLRITDFTDIKSLSALSQTNRLFYGICDWKSIGRRQELEIALIAAQGSDYDRFACFACLNVCPGYHFTDSQTRGKRGKNESQQLGRFCIPCGVKEGKLRRFSQVMVRGEPAIAYRLMDTIDCVAEKVGTLKRENLGR